MPATSPELTAFKKAVKGPERPWAFTRLLLQDNIFEQTQLFEFVDRGIDTRLLSAFVEGTRSVQGQGTGAENLCESTHEKGATRSSKRERDGHRVGGVEEPSTPFEAPSGQAEQPGATARA